VHGALVACTQACSLPKKIFHYSANCNASQRGGFAPVHVQTLPNNKGSCARSIGHDSWNDNMVNALKL
jgi:hypothetical protein